MFGQTISSLEMKVRTHPNLEPKRNYTTAIPSVPTIPGGNLQDKWMHFVVVFDTVTSGRPVTWYANGKLIQNEKLKQSRGRRPGILLLHSIGPGGGPPNGNGYSSSFKGDLASLRIYHKALTSAEAAQLYSATQSRFDDQAGNASDRTCGACTGNLFAPSCNMDACVAKTDCGDGEYMSDAGNASTDRTCSPCPSNSYSTGINNTGSCIPATPCAAVGGYETAAPTATTDRQCACNASAGYIGDGYTCAANPCDANEYVYNTTCTTCPSNSSNAAGDEEAGANTICDCDNGYYWNTGSQTCVAWASCGAGTRTDVEGTATQDRTCKSCGSGRFSTGSHNSNSSLQIPCPVGQGV